MYVVIYLALIIIKTNQKMDKKMKKPYESPSTQCTLVEMEAGLCAASITDDAKKGVKVTSNTQEYREFDVSTEEDKNAFTWD